MLSFACGTRDDLNIFLRPSAELGRRHVDVCLTLLVQLITLLGIHYLLEGELTLMRFAFCLWLLLIEIENHDGAVGEFCWGLEALWGCSPNELAAGAAVAYCKEGFDALGAYEIGESAYHALLQGTASFSAKWNQVLAGIPDVGRQCVVGTFLKGSVAALDDAFAGLDCGVRAEELACDETCRVHGSA